MKYQRQAKILELIKNNDVETQEGLTELLNAEGFNITQATVSRDIKELRLTKIVSKNGRYCYSASHNKEGLIYDRFKKLFRNAVLSIKHSGNTVVVKTLEGSANAAAAAIDAQEIEGIMGTVAGDDTIFIITEGEAISAKIVEVFKESLR